jgi:hypothetical protein
MAVDSGLTLDTGQRDSVGRTIRAEQIGLRWTLQHPRIQDMPRYPLRRNGASLRDGERRADSRLTQAGGSRTSVLRMGPFSVCLTRHELLRQTTLFRWLSKAHRCVGPRHAGSRPATQTIRPSWEGIVLSSLVFHLHPIFTTSWGFDSETAVWDSRLPRTGRIRQVGLRVSSIERILIESGYRPVSTH